MSDGAISVPPPPSLIRLATDAWTEPFWQAAARRRLTAPRCASCGAFRMPPTPFCPECRSQEVEQVELSGRATLYSYTVVDRAILPDMEGYIPYVPAVVEPEDAPNIRFVAALVGAPIGRIRVGAALRVTWSEAAQGPLVPFFELARP